MSPSQIRAGFGDDVVALVPPEDRTPGARLGPLPIDAVDEALPGSDIEAVLKLGRHGARLVHHRAAGPQQECFRFSRSPRRSAPGSSPIRVIEMPLPISLVPVFRMNAPSLPKRTSNLASALYRDVS